MIFYIFICLFIKSSNSFWFNLREDTNIKIDENDFTNEFEKNKQIELKNIINKQFKNKEINLNCYLKILENNINFINDYDSILNHINKINSFNSKSLMEYDKTQIQYKKELNNLLNNTISEYNLYVSNIIHLVNELQHLIHNNDDEIKYHQKHIDKMIINNYKLPTLNTIDPYLGNIIKTHQDVKTFEDSIQLNSRYYVLKDLIIPYTDNPYTEIYKLPCDYDKITPENKKILTKAEKKISLLSIDFNGEYIDLSESNIQYFINTFTLCDNLKEIIYPNTKEYEI